MSNTKHCYIAHNITADKLRFTEEIGGLVCPSIAITRNDISFANFGNITLLASADSLNLKKDPTFDADTSSVRYPQRFFKWDKKTLEAFSDKIDEVTKDLKHIHCQFSYHQDSDRKQGFAKAVESLTSDLRVLMTYARDNGIEPRIYRKPLNTEVSFIDDLEDRSGVLREMHTLDKKGYKVTSPEFQTVLKEAVKLFAIQKGKGRAGIEDKLLSRYFEDDGKGVLIFSYIHRVQDYLRMRKNDPNPVNTYKLTNRLNKLIDTPIKKERFIGWVSKHIEHGFHSPYFYNKNHIKKPYNADELLKSMKGLVNGHEYNSFGGAGNLRALLANRLTSFADVEDNMHKLIPEAKMKEVASQFNNRLVDFPEKMHSAYAYSADSFMYRDEVYRELEKFAVTGRVSSLQSFDGLDDEVVKELRVFFHDLQQAPTQYFEVKKQGLMQISDFSAAIIPRDTPEDVKKMLRSAGLNINTYEPQNNEDRLKCINKHKHLMIGSYLDNEISIQPPTHNENDEQCELSI